MKVLLTGGTGFLGKWLIERLLKAEDCEIVVLSRTAEKEIPISHEKYYSVSVLDYDALYEFCKKEKFSGIYHLAGYVEHSRKNPDVMYKIHIDGTRNVLKVAKELGIKRVVYSSTSGTTACFYSKDHIANDDSPYAFEITKNWPYYDSKIKAEIMALDYAKQNQIELIVLRPSLILGPGDDRFSSITLISEYLKKNIPLVPSGGVTLVDVRDTADAFYNAMIKGKPGKTYLLGSANLTHSQLYKDLEKLSGVSRPFLRIPAWILIFALRILFFFTYRIFGIWLKEKDPVWAEMGSVFWSLSSENAEKDLDFKPRDYKETLKDTISWIRQQENKKKSQ